MGWNPGDLRGLGIIEHVYVGNHYGLRVWGCRVCRRNIGERGIVECRDGVVVAGWCRAHQLRCVTCGGWFVPVTWFGESWLPRHLCVPRHDSCGDYCSEACDRGETPRLCAGCDHHWHSLAACHEDDDNGNRCRCVGW